MRKQRILAASQDRSPGKFSFLKILETDWVGIQINILYNSNANYIITGRELQETQRVTDSYHKRIKHKWTG